MSAPCLYRLNGSPKTVSLAPSSRKKMMVVAISLWEYQPMCASRNSESASERYQSQGR